jgi:hypothetical protein
MKGFPKADANFTRKTVESCPHQQLSETRQAFGNPFVTTLAAFRKISRN